MVCCAFVSHSLGLEAAIVFCGSAKHGHLFYAVKKAKDQTAIGPNPDISRVECTHIQGIRAEDVVVYLNALITQKMGALGSPEG